jgi:hypothetical protein
MTLSERLIALVSVPIGLVVAWALYLNLLGSIGPVELLEVLLLAIPIAIETSRILRAAARWMARRRATPSSVPATARRTA